MKTGKDRTSIKIVTTSAVTVVVGAALADSGLKLTGLAIVCLGVFGIIAGPLLAKLD